MPKKSESRREHDLTRVAEPETTADRIVLEIRKFLMAGIFFNARAAESVGMGLTDMQMVHTLQLFGPATPGKLAASTGLSSGGVTVALDRLEKAGYIRRGPNPADRRSLLITIVPAKLRKLAVMYEDIEHQTRQLLATMTDRDLEAVVRFFQTMGHAGAGAGSRP
ncbi:MAG TPA: MarR family transcriptional regulator [Terracidiphilus sp.]|nr:MarR family transcriptional regulator [Terracidiphilus sp.]